jgi:hypothetical protein
MNKHDIFLSRLKLLIIMSKAYLKGNPLGKYRKQAIAENANYVFYHSLLLVSEYAALKCHGSNAQTDTVSELETTQENLFHQRVQLLSVMAKALIRDCPMDSFRKKTLSDNLNKICETLIFNFKISDMNFLKVA